MEKQDYYIHYAKHCLVKSISCLQSAFLNYEHGNYGESVSRGYYAVFHACRGMLGLKGIVDLRKHEGVKSYFGLEFIKTGMMPKEFGKALTILKLKREIADYDPEYFFDKDEAEEILKKAVDVCLRCAEVFASLAQSEKEFANWYMREIENCKKSLTAANLDLDGPEP